ncbi:hypothetical protein LX36DRAFT_376159 [Colletotrichum falcatum]|nr:hypothetical protein LX36DRAFT_376159 [Colletotrichum falcatum]
MCLWNSIKAEFGSSGPAQQKTTSWATLPILVFESLTANWGDYVGSMHRAVELLKLDAQSTNPVRPNIGETDSSSLKTALDVMDRLQMASHVLESNIRIIFSIRREAETSSILWSSSEQLDEKLRFLRCADEVTRELEFQQSHVRSILSRLEAVTMMVRDLINVRNTLTMERMTARTIREAYTMRAIALLTLAFLPPTFIAGFLDLDYVNILMNNGKLKLQVEPGLWLYLAISLPLVVVIMSSYLWWDRRNLPKSVPEGNYV